MNRILISYSKTQKRNSISSSRPSKLAAHSLLHITCKQISNVRDLAPFHFALYLTNQHLSSTVFIHAQADHEAELFQSQLSTIVALTKGCKSAEVVRQLNEIPTGCGGGVVTSSIAIHTLVRVRSDPSFNYRRLIVNDCRVLSIST